MMMWLKLESYLLYKFPEESINQEAGGTETETFCILY